MNSIVRLSYYELLLTFCSLSVLMRITNALENQCHLHQHLPGVSIHTGRTSIRTKLHMERDVALNYKTLFILHFKQTYGSKLH